MTTITTRAAKGSPLSWVEVDANFTNLNDDKAEVSVVALKAPLASPDLTGVPTAPTATNGTNTTQLATTAFVQEKTAAQTPSTAVGTIVATNVQAALAELDTEKAALAGANFSGQVTATKLQTGVSGTSTNNFILDASAADGTMKLERGDGQDIMTVDAAGKVAFPQNPTSLVQANLGAGGTIDGAVLLQPVESIDLSNEYSSGRFTPKTPGAYLYTGAIQFITSGGVFSYAGLIPKKNGGSLVANVGAPYASSLYATATISGIIYMNGTTDYLEFWQDISVTGSPSITSGAFSFSLVKAY